MIRISKMADYAVVILASMAEQSGQIMSAAQLAIETHLSEPTVSKILKQLSKAEIVKASRGTNGGYALNNAAKDLAIINVIEAIDGPLAIVTCTDSQAPECNFTELCGIKGRWDDVNAAICNALRNVSLADMCENKCCAQNLAQSS